MTSYKINDYQEIEKNQLLKGVFIWVIHVNKIPPHIGISSNGIFYSLKVNGKDNGIPTDIILKLIEKKKIHTLFIELKSLELCELDLIYNRFKDLSSPEITCLTPIIEFLKEDSKIETVSELLVNLDKKNQIKSFFGLNLTDDFVGIPSYSKIDIQNRILKLQDVKRSNNFSESH